MSVKPVKFAERIKYERELRGWSQARMAEELETTPNRISTWERNLALPSAYLRERLCALLDTDAQGLGLLQSRQEESATTEVKSDLPPREQDESDVPVAQVEPLEPRTGIEEMAVQSKHLLVRKRKIVAAILVGIVVLAAGISLLFAYWHPFEINPYASHAGRLVLNDALRDQSSGVHWQEGTNANGASCTFKAGAYSVFQPMSGYFHACIAQTTDYRNFAYEVGMTVQRGDFGGIVFRTEDGIDAHYYLFRMQTDGTYRLYRFMDNSIEHAVLLDQGTSQRFKRGLGEKNIVAVVAQNDTMTMYINHTAVTIVSDAGYTHGAIGVLAGSLVSGQAEASFSDAKVWAW